jgi:O-acetyl-ADP-ribose deacetylase (regulator of RNase III)
MLDIVIGNIFDSKEKYLAHQTNCISKKSAGFAKDLFEKYNFADVYSNRTDPSQPGSIIISGDGIDQRFIISLMGQYYPGKPKYPLSTLDGTKTREKYFHKALMSIAKIKNLESIAFPWRIGCGLGGGNWEYYLGTITNFANFIYESHGAKVIIYKLEGEE